MKDTKAKTSLLAATAIAVAFGATSTAPMSAYADGFSHGCDACAELEELRQRIEELEEALETDVLRSTGVPGGYRIPGTDTTFRVGGFVKADFFYDVSEDVGDSFAASALVDPGADDDDPNFSAHARQTRLFVTSSTPTDFGELTTRIEADFQVNAGPSGGTETFSNSRIFRLRHAWITLGNWGFGQFWTNFMPIELYPSTVDFFGPAGISFIRQAQLRYTTSIDEANTLSFSLENPELTETSSVAGAALGVVEDQELELAPDVTAAWVHSSDIGTFRVAGVFRVLSVEGDTDFGYGGVVGGRVEVFPGTGLTGIFTVGDGIGRYIINGAGGDGFVNDFGEFETAFSYGVVAGIDHALTDEVSLHAVYGRYERQEAGGSPDALSFVQTVHVGGFWSPLSRVTFGLEGIFGNAELASGEEDTGVRVQGSVQVTF